jgi:hypothetical protein
MALPQEQIQTLNLGLRTLRFSAELAAMKLPTEATALVELALRERERSLEGKYNMVFIFSQLDKKGSNYWRQYGCESVEELLTKFDLPINKTLDRWCTYVELFSKETILTLGEELLHELTRTVNSAQPDSELRKRDYQNVFAEYARSNVGFDKTKFREAINRYVNVTYIKPQGFKVVSNIAPPPVAQGIRTVTRAEPIHTPAAEQVAPIVTREIVVEQRLDPWRVSALTHIARLESIILQRVGMDAVPERPTLLKGN